MRFVVIGVALLLNSWIQPTWLPLLRIAGAQPDTLLGILAIVGLLQGPFVGACTGFAGGLILGILFGPTIWLYPVLYALLGALFGLLQSLMHAREYILLPFAVAVVSFAKDMLLALVVHLTAPEAVMAFDSAVATAFVAAVYTAALSVPMLMLGRLFRKVSARRMRRMSDLL